MVRTLLRCWGFGLATAVSIAVGLFGLAFWGEQPALPLIRLPIPMTTLTPVLTTCLLTWTLHERWPQQLPTAVRRPTLVPTARFLGTQVTCLVAAAIAASPASHPDPVLQLSSIGASIAAVVTPALGGRTVFGLLIGAYVWLSIAAVQPFFVLTAHSGIVAVLALLGCGGLYVALESRRSSP